jgi:hypothetical protein
MIGNMAKLHVIHTVADRERVFKIASEVVYTLNVYGYSCNSVILTRFGDSEIIGISVAASYKDKHCATVEFRFDDSIKDHSTYTKEISSFFFALGARTVAIQKTVLSE